MMKKWAMEMKQSQVFRWAKWGKSYKLSEKRAYFLKIFFFYITVALKDVILGDF